MDLVIIIIIKILVAVAAACLGSLAALFVLRKHL
jgi:hypothetical protein